MQRSVGRIVGAREIRGISVAAIISFISAALLLRLLIYDSPASLSFNWSSQPALLRTAAAPPTRSVEDDSLRITNSTSESPADSPAEFPGSGILPLLMGMLAQSESGSEMGSEIESEMVRVWKYLKPVFSRPDLFPEARDRMSDAAFSWGKLMHQVNQDRLRKVADNASELEVHCPFSVSELNSSKLLGMSTLLEIPCGMVVDSSVTLVGVPDGLTGDDFRIELIGQKVPGETHPPVMLHYNVRLAGDQLSGQRPVIVQNTWTSGTDWEDEQRCPAPASKAGTVNKTVDGLVICAGQVGKEVSASESSVKWPVVGSVAKKQPWFPFADSHPFALTLWAGWDGFHVTVDGKHITSFEYRQNLEPWMVNGVNIEGGLQLSSVIANGLPTSESQETLIDLESLKAPPLQQPLDLFIGVFSTGNNFERRMAVRRSWMQYEDVRSGKIAVRFFVGLHQNQQVNMELWKEGATYGDIQLLPFVDYYNLITLKTLAICIYATKAVNSRYVMKTDDDTFVRVDQVLASIRASKQSENLLYGQIESVSKPDRDIHSKWYITKEEWAAPLYPPWAHGPGYIFSKDIAKFVVESNESLKLKLFKLEDVAMGAWIQEYSRTSQRNISYIDDRSFLSDGCKVAYTIAHYQNPRQMVCLWNQLRHGSGPVCC